MDSQKTFLETDDTLDVLQGSSKPLTVKSSKDNLIVIILFSVFGLTFFNSLSSVVLIALYASSVSQKPPTLVQLVNGKSIAATSFENSVRSPEFIRQFVLEQLTNLMTWTGELPPDANGKVVRDIGIEITSTKGEKKLVSSSSWQAAFGLSEDFRTGMLSSIATLTPSDVFNGTTKVILVPRSLTNPEETTKGRWKLNLVANLITFTSQNPAGVSVPFNKEIFIQTIDIPNLRSNPTAIEQVIFKVRSAGLEIYSMRDLVRTDLR